MGGTDMKKIFLICILLLHSGFSMAEVIAGLIHSIHSGVKGEAHLVFFEEGEVVFLRGEAKSILNSLEEARRRGEHVKVEVDSNHNLLSIQSMAPTTDHSQSLPPEELELMSYTPSILSASTASSVFYRMRRDYQYQSQCYNRAHVWTYEEYRRSAIRSNKLFLFFTTRYIRAYNYKWWFHVTPMVYVGGTTSAYWRTLDRRYTSGPLTIRTWTNIFMYNDANCPIVYNWSDYYYRQSTQYCYLIPKSMYFWQPRDIRIQEESGYQKSQYFTSEINYAYWEAF
jgi:hypothetical protein